MVDTAPLDVLDAMLSPVTSRRDDFYLLATPRGFQAATDDQPFSTMQSIAVQGEPESEDLTSWLAFLDAVERSQPRPTGARLLSPTGPSRKRLRTSFLADFSWDNQQNQRKYISADVTERSAKVLHFETSGDLQNKPAPHSLEDYWQQPRQQQHSINSPLFFGLSPRCPASTVPRSFHDSELPKSLRVELPQDKKSTPKQLSPGIVSAHSGEMRLRINFESFGEVDEHTPVFGKSGFLIPDGLCGRHDMYDQHWRFEIRHENALSLVGSKGAVTKLITWIITNETSGSITCITENPQQAALRELSGRTICNKVVRVALNHRAEEIEASLPYIKNEAKRQALASEAAALRPRLCTVGLLFFGLLHEGVQVHLRQVPKGTTF